jgi:hypothetical protein
MASRRSQRARKGSERLPIASLRSAALRFDSIGSRVYRGIEERGFDRAGAALGSQKQMSSYM